MADVMHAGHPNPLTLQRAAGMLKAAGDAERLRILALLLEGSMQVSEIAKQTSAGLSTTSQRLKLLRSEGLVVRSRRGREMHYSLADSHVRDLIANVIDHADPTHLNTLNGEDS